jgi:hypothetical protein
MRRFEKYLNLNPNQGWHLLSYHGYKTFYQESFPL